MYSPICYQWNNSKGNGKHSTSNYSLWLYEIRTTNIYTMCIKHDDHSYDLAKSTSTHLCAYEIIFESTVCCILVCIKFTQTEKIEN